MPAGVYQIVNKISGSMYVGSATNLRHRWAAHLSSLRKHGKAPPKLQRAWDKYGEEAFEFRVVANCLPENALQYEQLVIDALEPRYNTRAIAHSNFGVKWSEDTNLKKGRPKNVYTVQGVTGGLADLCRHFGVVSYTVANSRVKRGMPADEAVMTPKVSRQEIGKRMVATKRKNGTLPSRARIMQVGGERGSITDLAAKFGLPYSAVRTRLASGWDTERAFLTPIGISPRHRSGASNGKSKLITVRGFTGNIREVAEHFGVSYQLLLARLHADWPHEDAVFAPRYSRNPNGL